VNGERHLLPPAIRLRKGEEMRCLRTRVISAFEDERHRVLLVTSAVPQEGKSSVSASLARSFALTGRRTLLVDCDLRRPEAHHIFGLKRERGVADVVRARLPLDSALAGTDHPDLEVLTAGSLVETPAELIGSRDFHDFLRQVAGLYDLVVLDAPPLLSITDTLVLSHLVDGILLVVKGFSTPREIVKSGLDLLEGRPLLGVVLNGITTPKGYGYY
jgi:capsular exopolysaccharide synthesis family protein